MSGGGVRAALALAALAALLLGGARTAGAQGGPSPASLKELREALWGPGRRGAAHRTPTVADRAALGVLVPALLRHAAAAPDADAAGLAAAARLVGLELHDWRYAGVRFWALLEPPEEVRGRGVYVVRVAPTPAGQRPVVVQAPHAYYDTGTGRLAAWLFFRPPQGAPAPAALFANSVKRFQAGGDPDAHREGRASPADVSHERAHPYSAATVAAARALGDPVFVQLHGFAKERLPEDARAATEIIVSAGRKERSSARVERVAAALAGALGVGAKRFPEEVGVLGGTASAQARALRDQVRAAFVHLELSAELRRRLGRDRELRRAFGRALLQAAAAPGE